jgi:purine-nucleoside phosphorylase
MLHFRANIDEAVTCIRARWPHRPRVGIILGTGLGGLAEDIRNAVSIDYAVIPHFPASTATGHVGRLVCGELSGVSVVAMQGRFHAYEGYSAAQITLPVRVMQALGIQLLIVSNASGGLNPNFRTGDILLIEDHINLMAVHPLMGVNDQRLGPRFPDTSQPYDRALIDRVMEIARREKFAAHVGVYAGLSGPNYETRAEYRFLRRIGADAVGMSTIPEVIVAAHAGLRVLGLSAITNICLPDAIGQTKGEDVVKMAAAAEGKLRTIVHRLLCKI